MKKLLIHLADSIIIRNFVVDFKGKIKSQVKTIV